MVESSAVPTPQHKPPRKTPLSPHQSPRHGPWDGMEGATSQVLAPFLLTRTRDVVENWAVVHYRGTGRWKEEGSSPRTHGLVNERDRRARLRWLVILLVRNFSLVKQPRARHVCHYQRVSNRLIDRSVRHSSRITGGGVGRRQARAVLEIHTVPYFTIRTAPAIRIRLLRSLQFFTIHEPRLNGIARYRRSPRLSIPPPPQLCLLSLVCRHLQNPEWTITLRGE